MNSEVDAVDAAFAAWRDKAARVGGRDTMLHFRDSRDGSIDLSGAHPSGLAQLLAGRSTRLSSLIRDPEHIGDARRRAHSIRQKAVQLSYERGINTAHLAIGFATWTRDIDGTRRDFSAPILLRHVTLVPRGSGADDYEIVLADDIVINPALVEYLATEHDVRIDVDEWTAATGYSHGFDPAPVLDRLRSVTRGVPGILVNQRLVISTFANIATPFTRSELPGDHPILRALAGDQQARAAFGVDEAEDTELSSPAAEDEQSPAPEGPAGAGEESAPARDRQPTTDGREAPASALSPGVMDDNAPKLGESSSSAPRTETAEAAETEPDDAEETPAQGDETEAPDSVPATRPALDDAADGEADEPGEPRGSETAESAAGGEETTAAGEGEGASAEDVDDAADADDSASDAAGSDGEDAAAHEAPPRRKRPTTRPTALPDREPQEEFLVLDVDGDQQAVVDAAMAGESFVVDTPPGTGATQVAVATAATLAHVGKSVLYVAQSSDALDDFAARMTRAGLGDFTVDGRLRETELKKQLITLILDAERAKKPELAELVTELGALRQTLIDHTDALHRVRQPWNASVHATMERLASLTASDEGPVTDVRFTKRVMELGADARESLRSRLIEFSEKGAFTLDVEDTVWFGAKFDNDARAESARSAAERAAALMPALISAVEPVLRRAGMNPPRSIGDWGACLELLVATQSTLETFTPAVYTADLDALLGATGTGEYRRRNNLDQGVFERNRLKRSARELLRDTGRADELHVLLARVRDERAEWIEQAGPQAEPAVPDGVAEAHELFAELDGYLTMLSPVLADTPDGGDLDGMLIQELQARLEALGEDRAALADLPARTKLDATLRQEGLGELLDDLRRRRVRHSLVGQEFDLAYWATVLQQIASQDPSISRHQSDALHETAQDFRDADRAFVDAGSDRLRFSHASGWRKAIFEHKAEAESVRAALRGAHLHIDDIAEQAPHVLAALAPVWMMSPFEVPNFFRDGQFFDAVIIADGARLSVPEAIPAITRARQVIVLGDDRLPGPRAFSVAVDRHSRPKDPESESVFSELAEFLPVRGLHNSHRIAPRGLIDLANSFFYRSSISMVPTALTTEGSGLEFAYVPDALGAPDSATGQVESPDQEVSKVVDLVLRHARTKTRQSLAVVTLTPWHAGRVAAAIQTAIRAYPYVASFFNDTSKEPFIVTDAEKVQGIARDAVIFSLGYGRSLQGRVLYNFGALDRPGSERLLAAVITRARRRLTVVSSFEPDDFDRARLHNGAALLPDLLAAVAVGTRTSANEPESPERFEDPLVSDIAERLVRRGVSPLQGYGGIDLAVPIGKSEEQGMALAVETDGRDYAAVASVRERERLRPEALNRRGWTYQRLWSMDAFVDPQEQTERIFTAWKQSVEARSPQALLDAARNAEVVTNRQGSRPKVTPGLPLHSYSEGELDEMIRWIQSDGVFRDDAEIAEQLGRALVYRAKSPDYGDIVGRAVRRYRASLEKRREDDADDPQDEPADTTDSAENGNAESTVNDRDGRTVSERDIMPGYDTGMLRADDLIDAGLRQDEPAEEKTQRDD